MESDKINPGNTQEELKAYLKRHILRVSMNLGRAKFLVEFVENFLSDKPTFSLIKDDILRAAVVFLHASLEDFLRYLGSKYIPSSGEEVLNRISLVGSSDVLRPEKFFLGRLANYRGKTVDELISESVTAYLDRLSFNNVTDICQLLDSVGIVSDKFTEYYPSLSELMARRHQIVHRADVIEPDNKERFRDPMPIDSSKVTAWYSATMDFASAVAAYKLQEEFGDRIRKERHDSASKDGTTAGNDGTAAGNGPVARTEA